MMNFSKVCAWAGLLLLGGITGQAQQNLIQNPSFEDPNLIWGDKGSHYLAAYWSTPSSYGLNPSLTSDGHTGKALRVEPNSTASFRTTLYQTNGEIVPNYIELTPGGKYKLSFWYRTSSSLRSDATMKVRLPYQQSDDTYDTAEQELKSMTKFKSTAWKQETIEFTAPDKVVKAGIEINIRYARGENIDFDDFSLVMIGTPPPPPVIKPDAPTGLTHKAHQREIELSWATAPNATWEVAIEGSTLVKETNTNSFTLDNLEPNQTYKIKLRSKVNGEYSDYTEQSITTLAMEQGESSAERVPYLRTISENGTCPKVLNLYYNELASKNAVITYKIDDLPAVAQEGKLTFDKTGKQKLSIEIVESNDKAWSLEYYVNVQ